MNDVIPARRGPYGQRTDRATPVRDPGVCDRPNPQQWCGSIPAAAIVGCSVGHLYRLVGGGAIRTYRPEGAHAMFWIPELQAYQERSRRRA